MPRVYIGDKLDAEGLELLKAAGLEVDNRPGLKDAELQEALRAADGAIVRSAPKVTAALLADPGRLRAIARAGVGVDNIDVPAATRKGVVVMNTPGGNTLSTAEHTLALLYALVRQLPAAHASLAAGKWERGKFVGAQLAGKTLGVVGLGRIGREVAKRALAMDMKVIGYDPVLAADRAAQFGIEAVPDVDTLLKRCDVVTLHVPLTDQTRNLIGARELGLMKKGSRLINCARGGLVNEAALVEALKGGQLAGAAVDVFEQEPPPADHPLLKLPNVVVTPHLGASTAEAQRSVAIEAAQLMTDYLIRGAVQCAVNMAPIDRAELQELKLYLDMARRLGLLHAQMDQGVLRRVTLLYRGEAAERNTRLITAAFACGLLESRLAEGVNIVNAEVLAKERGIEFVEQKSAARGDLRTLVRADVETDQQTYQAGATLFGNQYLRLCRLGEFHLDAHLDGTLLLFRHRDAPGLIGFIGTVFGKHQVNIAQMTVGRQTAGGEAIAVLQLDSPPPEAALAEVRAHPQIRNVTVAVLPPVGELPAWLG
jgi:D-3-phosphoglycerate dehydrogenase